VTDKELIENVKIAMSAKDIKTLAKMINIPYITLARWHSKNYIPENGAGRQYLNALLKIAEQEKELILHRELSNTLNAIHNIQKDGLDN